MIAGPEDPNSGRVFAAKTSRSDTLSYISDIVHELKRLAEKAEYRTLAAILGVALVEARTQSKESER
jgi:hypothetical protein